MNNERLTDIDYVRDAILERLPSGWSLAHSPVDPETARYRWTDWRTARSVAIDVKEGYLAGAPDVDFLCDQLYEAVRGAFASQYAFIDTSPISPERWKAGAD